MIPQMFNDPWNPSFLIPPLPSTIRIYVCACPFIYTIVSWLTFSIGRNLSPSQTLASKSNYQCNFGKDLPELGLSYPETFYAKMEEKREYHKNAEKDRRDRMKEALEALSRVIPQRSATDTGGNMRRDNCTKGSSPSRISREDKAALIRAAVLYIEELQQALKDRKLKQD